MIKKLTQIGNSLGLIIDRPILDLLQIDRDTPLEIKTDGRQLIIRPAASGGEQVSVREMAKSGMEKFAEVLKKLAEQP